MTHPFAVYKRLILNPKMHSDGNGPQKKAGVAILISDRLDFKLKIVVRDTEGHYIILKVCIQQVEMTIIKIYAPTGEQQDTQANS